MTLFDLRLTPTRVDARNVTEAVKSENPRVAEQRMLKWIHFIREILEDGVAVLSHVSGKLNFADGLTKRVVTVLDRFLGGEKIVIGWN